MADAGKLAEIEATCAVAFDPAPPTSPEQASRKAACQKQCQDFARAPGAWNAALQFFLSTRQTATSFFCLQVLEGFVRGDEFLATRPDARELVHKSLLGYLSANAASVGSMQPYVKNKIALVLCHLLRRQFLDTWRSAFTDLRAALMGNDALMDMMMRVLTILDDEVVCATIPSVEEHAHNQAIKNAMRETGVPSALAEFWHSVMTTYRATNPQIVASALESLQRYISWIDVGLVANDKFVPLFFEFLRDDALREGACGCLYELMHKGMDDVAKVQLIASTRVLDVLGALPINVDSLDDADFNVDLAELVRVIGLCLSGSGCSSTVMATPDACATAATELRKVLGLMFKFFASTVAEVSMEMIPMIDGMVSCLKREHAVVTEVGGRLGTPVHVPPTLPPPAAAGIPGLSGGFPLYAAGSVGSGSTEGRGGVSKALLRKGNGCPANVSMFEFMAPLLQILVKNMQYPADFLFRPNGEEEAQFYKYRALLQKVFVNITRTIPDVVLALLRAVVEPKLGSLAALPFQEAELALHITFHYAEGCRNAVRPGSPVMDILVAIHKSGVDRHPHHAVLLAYFELTSRYGKLFQSRPDLLPSVLNAMVGPTGLGHSHALVRSRASYLFQKLLKAVLNNKTIMEPLLGPLFSALTPILTKPVSEKSAFSASDLSFLYQACGMLIGQSWVPAPQQLEALKVVMVPLLQQLSEGLTAAGRGPGGVVAPADVDVVGMWAERLLGFIASLSKGFGVVEDGIASLFSAAVEGALSCLSRVRGHTGTHSKVLFIMHEMVSSLGLDLLQKTQPSLPLLLGVNDVKIMCDVLRLWGQFMARFKAAAMPIISELLLPTIKRVFEVLPPDGPPESDDAVDRRELQRGYFGFLTLMVSEENSQVLLSATNAPHLSNVLGTIVQGITSVPDAKIKKMCIAFFISLCSQWLPAPAGPGADGPGSPLPADSLALFYKFLWESVVPALYEQTLKPDFKLDDAGYVSVVNESLKLHMLLATRATGAAGSPCFLTHLRASVLPAFGVPEDHAVRYTETLAANLSTPRGFTTTLMQMVGALQASRRVA